MSFRESADTDRSILVVAGSGEISGHDRATGERRWNHVMKIRVLGMDARIGGAFELAIHDGRVYVASSNRLVCIVLATGELIGEVALDDQGARPTLLIDGGLLYLASSQWLYCLTLEGQTVWRQKREHRAGDGLALGFPGNVRQGDSINHS